MLSAPLSLANWYHEGFHFKCHSLTLTVVCYSLLFGAGRPWLLLITVGNERRDPNCETQSIFRSWTWLSNTTLRSPQTLLRDFVPLIWLKSLWMEGFSCFKWSIKSFNYNNPFQLHLFLQLDYLFVIRTGGYVCNSHCRLYLSISATLTQKSLKPQSGISAFNSGGPGIVECCCMLFRKAVLMSFR